jgi:hypothetical protein
MHVEALKKRIEGLLQLTGDDVHELWAGTLTVATAAYGAESHQVTSIASLSAKLETGHFESTIRAITLGVLRSLKTELDSGITGSLQRQIAGGVLSDFVQLARIALDHRTDAAKNVAAVLVAAAFEDTVRRVGSTFAGIVGKEDLQDILIKLKDNGVLVAPQFGIAQSYLSFRNRALHANWNEIERETVLSALAFTEELLIKHFS